MVRLPLFFIDIVWDTRLFNDPLLWPTDDSQPFVFSRAIRASGFGRHADYVFGREGDSVKRAMDTCTSQDGSPNCSELTVQDIETSIS
ncbi:hypothetical protein BKA70DRAFT_1123076 [Coprinopsis sp. MPI-PUGE-AT-0042]|nr:hypothetical protein BKA70DRAFT_1123076 [Coprinopsis sp. MPI-PUGE-AT-0042]